MKRYSFTMLVGGVVVIGGMNGLAASAQLPPDVRKDHWAAAEVQQALSSGVMKLEDDHQFHGEAHVTHVQAVVALAAVAKKLESYSWAVGPAHPVPDNVGKTLTTGDWKSKPVTRYQLASTLIRFANYYAKIMTKDKVGKKDLAKSKILYSNVKIPVPATSPVYASYKLLTDGRMISNTSPLLKADNLPLKPIELSNGISEVAAGITDHLTELGLDENGSTPDKTFHQPKPGQK